MVRGGSESVKSLAAWVQLLHTVNRKLLSLVAALSALLFVAAGAIWVQGVLRPVAIVAV